MLHKDLCTITILFQMQDILDDVEGALRAGLKAILVRTGKFRPEDENRSSIAPTAVCDNFSAAVDYILGP